MMRRAQPWLGTLVEVALADPVPEAMQHAAVAAAFAEVAMVQRLMSFHDAASDVSRLNRAAPGESIAVDGHTWSVLALAQRLRTLSCGVFNIACAPRLVEWDYLPAPAAQPSRFEPMLEVYTLEAGGQVRKLANGWVDLGGIAKGHAVDLAITALERAGMQDACVNAGGDLRVLGQLSWPVLIRAPHAPRRPGATLQLKDAAMATSADYFSARRAGDEQVCALIDGRSGNPVLQRGSVSVRAPLCVTADALTKVILATGDIAHPALALLGASAFII